MRPKLSILRVNMRMGRLDKGSVEGGGTSPGTAAGCVVHLHACASLDLAFVHLLPKLRFLIPHLLLILFLSSVTSHLCAPITQVPLLSLSHTSSKILPPLSSPLLLVSWPRNAHTHTHTHTYVRTSFPATQLTGD